MPYALKAIKILTAMVISTAVAFSMLLVSTPDAEAASSKNLDVSLSDNKRDFQDKSHDAKFVMKVTARYEHGKRIKGKARVYVNGKHLQTRNLSGGRVTFKVSRSSLPDRKRAEVKVRVMPASSNYRDKVVKRHVVETPGVSKGDKIVKAGMSQVGDKYRLGASGMSSWDCSGLSAYAVRKGTGKRIPHSSSAQRNYGKAIPRGQKKPGDLILSRGHVSIYKGGGKVVEAANPRAGVRVARLWQKNYVVRRF